MLRSWNKYCNHCNSHVKPSISYLTKIANHVVLMLPQQMIVLSLLKRTQALLVKCNSRLTHTFPINALLPEMILKSRSVHWHPLVTEDLELNKCWRKMDVIWFKRLIVKGGRNWVFLLFFFLFFRLFILSCSLFVKVVIRLTMLIDNYVSIYR